MKTSILFDLGQLHRMIIISRPSVTVKSPYVADMAPYSKELFAMQQQPLCKDETNFSKAMIALLSSQLRNCAKDDTITLGHTPSLDCAGMIVPGASVLCTKNDQSKATKTSYTVQLCEEIRGKNDHVIVGCHPFLAERAAKRLLELKLLPEIGDYDVSSLVSQVTYGNSRVDYVIPSKDGVSITLLEIKNVVGADYCEGFVPSQRSPVGVYTMPLVASDGTQYARHAIFPHGSKKPKIGVVSDRAIKHVHELTTMHGTLDLNGKTIQSVILFIVNRSDCDGFRPCHEACMLFAQVLRRAQEKGVMLLIKELIWDHDQCSVGRSLPVVFDAAVKTSDIDEQWLHNVLHFNENGDTRTYQRVSATSKSTHESSSSERRTRASTASARKKGKRS